MASSPLNHRLHSVDKHDIPHSSSPTRTPPQDKIPLLRQIIEVFPISPINPTMNSPLHQPNPSIHKLIHLVRYGEYITLENRLEEIQYGRSTVFIPALSFRTSHLQKNIGDGVPPTED